jgi:two-component system sensor
MGELSPTLAVMKPRSNALLWMIHILSWTYIFLSPLLFTPQNIPIDWRHILSREFFSLALLLTFYLNYFLLVPKFFLTDHHRTFYGCNLLLIIALSGLYELMHEFMVFKLAAQSLGLPHDTLDFSPGHKHFGTRDFKVFFFFRNIVNLTFALGCALAARLSGRWYAAEMARSKAELERAEAELQSLKSQISPHFLLNTLNNIYALTSIDTEKAQSAILELSKMLRYQLYEELGSCVSVEREVEFLQNYVALMRLRLNKNVEVTTDFRLTPHKEMQVAPHIFISIVENAFKHGVSITAPSHVHLRLDCDGKRLNFDCRNSYFPQRTHENPDGGIGLRLVKSRLELSYPGTHTWEHGIDSSRKEYYSRITLDL